MILFLGIRTAVLRRKNSYFLSLWLLPFFTAFTFWIATFFIVQKASGQPALPCARHASQSFYLCRSF